LRKNLPTRRRDDPDAGLPGGLARSAEESFARDGRRLFRAWSVCLADNELLPNSSRKTDRGLTFSEPSDAMGEQRLKAGFFDMLRFEIPNAVVKVISEQTSEKTFGQSK
jgi:hypothetical protein